MNVLEHGDALAALATRALAAQRAHMMLRCMTQSFYATQADEARACPYTYAKTSNFCPATSPINVDHPTDDSLDAQRRQQLWDSLGVTSVVPPREEGTGGDTTLPSQPFTRGSQHVATPPPRASTNESSGLWDEWGMEAALKRVLML